MEQIVQSNVEKVQRPEDYVFAMDIGTRSIIGMVGYVQDDKFCVVAIEKEAHSVRAMVDGQIEDIDQVAKVAKNVKEKLENQLSCSLENVYVAAAGRALKTQKASFIMELEESQEVSEETLRLLENGALEVAEQEFDHAYCDVEERQFYLVGYSVCQYYLDNYPISTLLGHRGRVLKADVIATFLPSEVVESLYYAMKKANLEVAGLTLEPIASMNAAIPKNLRLLNLVLVDIGAGTSDIAVARDGSICGYTMATIAGDEITESLMKEYLISFDAAENLKMSLSSQEEFVYVDVLGFEHCVTKEEVETCIQPFVQALCKQIAEKIVEVNGGSPSAVFLTGGGSKLSQVKEFIADYLEMDHKRVALGGNNFSIHASSETYELKDPEYSTPLGIAISAGLNLINDSFYIRLNGQRAKLFRSGRLTVRDILMMNGYGYKHMISRSGQSLAFEVDGVRKVTHGEYATPALLEVNGQVAALSDVVSAGDEISFTPAINGADAKAKLEDVVSVEEKGIVFVDGIEVPIGVFATVNGLVVGKTTMLSTGDKIKTRKIITLEDLIEEYQLGGYVFVNDEQVAMDWVLEPGDHITLEALGDKKTKEELLRFFINGAEICVNKKENNVSYLVVDMLPYTQMDFMNPKGIVAIKVNGGSANFQTELKEFDKISIYWEEK